MNNIEFIIELEKLRLKIDNTLLCDTDNKIRCLQAETLNLLNWDRVKFERYFEMTNKMEEIV